MYKVYNSVGELQASFLHEHEAQSYAAPLKDCKVYDFSPAPSEADLAQSKDTILRHLVLSYLGRELQLADLRMEIAAHKQDAVYSLVANKAHENRKKLLAAMVEEQTMCRRLLAHWGVKI